MSSLILFLVACGGAMAGWFFRGLLVKAEFDHLQEQELSREDFQWDGVLRPVNEIKSEEVN